MSAVRERPILFSAPMVRAILGGSKTVTRRIVKWPAWVKDEVAAAEALRRHPALGDFQDGRTRHVFTCPFGVPGDTLWVRETFAVLTGNGIRPVYRADGEKPVANMRWTPSIHMERRWSRLTLEVTSVRVERLQSITEADAIAEGARRFDDIPDPHPYGEGPRWSMESPTSTDQCLRTPQFAFASLWNSISDDATDWYANPWVWCVSFKRIESAEARRAG